MQSLLDSIGYSTSIEDRVYGIDFSDMQTLAFSVELQTKIDVHLRIDITYMLILVVFFQC